MVQVREPCRIAYCLVPVAVLTDTLTRLDRKILIDAEPHLTRAGAGHTEPNLLTLNVRPDLFVGDRVHVTEYQKLLAERHQLRDILGKQREGRVSNDDVGLLKKLHTLVRAK